MKRYIVLIIFYLILFYPLSFSFAQPVSGIVADHGKVKQPMDTATSAKEKMSKNEARNFGRDTARQFYEGQIAQEEADRRYRQISDKNLQREYKRGYNFWKGQNLVEKKEEKKQE